MYIFTFENDQFGIGAFFVKMTDQIARDNFRYLLGIKYCKDDKVLQLHFCFIVINIF